MNWSLPLAYFILLVALLELLARRDVHPEAVVITAALGGIGFAAAIICSIYLSAL